MSDGFEIFHTPKSGRCPWERSIQVWTVRKKRFRPRETFVCSVRTFKQKTVERMCRDNSGDLFVASLFLLLRLKLKMEISHTNLSLKDHCILRSDAV
jgi:hypothetical protein